MSIMPCYSALSLSDVSASSTTPLTITFTCGRSFPTDIDRHRVLAGRADRIGKDNLAAVDFFTNFFAQSLRDIGRGQPEPKRRPFSPARASKRERHRRDLIGE